MPDTAFALWQSRTGLTRAVDAAKALGVTRRTVERLRNGEQQPHPSTRRLMAVIERPELLDALTPRSFPTARL